MASECGLAVIGVGGNSLIVSEDKQGIPDQAKAAEATVHHIADVIAKGWNVIITHGSGPQVGFILRRSEIAINEVAPVPMDYADADIQGAVGYMFQRALHNEFHRRGLDRKAVAVVTQVKVDPADPAFECPNKPIGPQLDEATARRRAKELGWVIAEDSGRGWRRVVPSPLPQEILEMEQIKLLAAAGYIVIACGGGGIPVLADPAGEIRGVEAVVDKDLASSLLATQIGAELFLLSTSVDRIALNFNTSEESWLDRVTLAEARTYSEAGHFAAGSMGPKVTGMIQYLEGGGTRGVITDPDHIGSALQGIAGTHFVL